MREQAQGGIKKEALIKVTEKTGAVKEFTHTTHVWLMDTVTPSNS